MEEFNVEREENKILINREPETWEEFQKFRDVVMDALVYAFLSDSPHIVYPNEQGLKKHKTL